MIFVCRLSLPQVRGLLGPLQYGIFTDRIYAPLMISARRLEPATEHTLAECELLSVPRQLPIPWCHTASRRALEALQGVSARGQC